LPFPRSGYNQVWLATLTTVEKRISEETLPRTDLQVDGERQRTTTEGTGLEEKRRHGALGMIRPLDSCCSRSKKPHEEARRSSDLPAQKWKKPLADKQVSWKTNNKLVVDATCAIHDIMPDLPCHGCQLPTVRTHKHQPRARKR